MEHSLSPTTIPSPKVCERDSWWVSDTETRQLGHHQLRMIAFIRRNSCGHPGKRFSLGSDWLSRRTAISLKRRGLIRISKPGTTCWMISLPLEG